VLSLTDYVTEPCAGVSEAVPTLEVPLKLIPESNLVF